MQVSDPETHQFKKKSANYDTQQNYRIFGCETLMMIEALLKWEDKLLRFKFNIITNHKALGYLKTQQKLSSRQICWIKCISQFDTEIIYTKDSKNHIKDCLSCYYKREEMRTRAIWHHHHHHHCHCHIVVRVRATCCCCCCCCGLNINVREGEEESEGEVSLLLLFSHCPCQHGRWMGKG